MGGVWALETKDSDRITASLSTSSAAREQTIDKGSLDEAAKVTLSVPKEWAVDAAH